MVGGLDFGPRRGVPKMARLLADAGVPHEVLPPDEAAARWPGMVFEGEVLFHEQAGTMDAAGAVAAMLAQAAGAGAQVLASTEVVAVADARPAGDPGRRRLAGGALHGGGGGRLDRAAAVRRR